MNILTVDNLRYRWGDTELLRGASMSLQEGEKVALVARNGAGKSTLLGLLTEALLPGAPHDASITWRNGLRVGYLPQEPLLDPADNALAAAVKHLDPANQADNELRARQTLGRLGITDAAQPLSQMSGGQRKRVALARLLLEEPQCLILDEPTNHLDLGVISWLEGYLGRARTTLLMVTHDRYFLDRVCGAIIELDGGQLYRYDGGYATYLARRQERLDQARSETAKARNLLRREQEWMNRQPQARGTKAQYRIDAFDRLQEKARQRQEQRNYTLDFAASRLGRKVADLEHVSKAYGHRQLIADLSYKFARGERVAIVGDNGAGKSTLLGLIDGQVTPDAGTVTLGETVVVGHYRQDGIVVDDGKTVLEVIEDIADQVQRSGGHTVPAAQFLRQFLFPNELHHVRVSSLSGGERKRLYLVTVLLRQPNLLLLDEPTNDLDILSLGVLEEFLEGFAGTAVVVSHDRCFVDRVADHLLALDGEGHVKDFPGNYSEYQSWLQSQPSSKAAAEPKPAREQATPPAAGPASQRNANRPKRLSYAQQRELAQIEQLLPTLQARQAEIEALLSGGTSDAGQIATLSAEYATLKERLDEAENRWLELSELNGD